MSIPYGMSDAYYDAPDGTEWTDQEEDQIESAARTLVNLCIRAALDDLGDRCDDVPGLTEDQFTEAEERASMALESLVSCPECHRVGGHKKDCGRKR